MLVRFTGPPRGKKMRPWPAFSGTGAGQARTAGAPTRAIQPLLLPGDGGVLGSSSYNK
jgi:hypothetical protein